MACPSGVDLFAGFDLPGFHVVGWVREASTGASSLLLRLPLISQEFPEHWSRADPARNVQRFIETRTLHSMRSITMHLIIRYHRPMGSQETDRLLPENDWLPTWRIDGPDETPDHTRSSSVSLTGETRLPILPAGAVLEQGDIYLDLRNPAHGPFRSLGGQTAGTGNAYVAKGELPPDFWDQLVRICSRAGDLVLDASRTGPSFDVVLVLEPAGTPSSDQAAVS